MTLANFIAMPGSGVIAAGAVGLLWWSLRSGIRAAYFTEHHVLRFFGRIFLIISLSSTAADDVRLHLGTWMEPTSPVVEAHPPGTTTTLNQASAVQADATMTTEEPPRRDRVTTPITNTLARLPVQPTLHFHGTCHLLVRLNSTHLDDVAITVLSGKRPESQDCSVAISSGEVAP